MTERPDQDPGPPARTAERAMPGDLSREGLIDRIIRVDQAGEYGAVRIYAGQLAVLPEGPTKDAVRVMAKQEAEHLKAFDKLMVERRARPTALQPLWHVAGFALGAATALLGPRAAMACTVAVEEAIDEHYAAQAAQLGEDEKALRGTIEEFRADELEHRATALEHEAERAPAYPLLSAAIKTGSRLAIWLSERV
ncbi:MAG: demethoxyubiquinone hydroxylase family protein [Alphaproteobacteria bacterium]|nr:demethoxyubiquinone hydroxylase family protein [Alphaproteobacteria bacterium]